MDDLRAYVRAEGIRYLDSPNINSVGIGLKVSSKGPSGALCVSFTVDEKVQPERLERLGTRLIPPNLVIGGRVVPTDVIQRRYRRTWQPVNPEAMSKDRRKERQQIIAPGMSVAHREGSAGTVGAIVFDRATGAPMMLSNWHVFQLTEDDREGAIHDDIVQPGPFDDNRVGENVAGHLVRSHLGPAGDCAVSSIEGRSYDREILGLKVAPARVGRAELGDHVIKSGRTTAVTRGMVTRVDVQTRMTYRGRPETIGGFEISAETGADPRAEITTGGDSGSAWLAFDPKTKRATDVMLGLHFAGEDSDSSAEFALACAAHSVIEKLDVELQPSASIEAAVAERVFGGSGYDPDFLGVSLPLPVPATAAMGKDMIGADGKRVADYTHYTLSIRKSRRLPAFVAWNIDGRITKPDSKSATWQKDPRVPAEFQIDDTLYAGTLFDRGHIAKREDLLWGGKGVAKHANDDSFCFTNATPQHEKFNRMAPALWKSLEDEIFRQVSTADLKISLLGGPLFKTTDREFKPSAAPKTFQPVKIPREFYKIVAYRDQADQRLRVLAFKLSQADLVSGKLESVVPEALDLQKFEMYQVSVANLEKATGLSFAGFRKFDVKAHTEGVGPESLVPPVHRVESFADITF